MGGQYVNSGINNQTKLNTIENYTECVAKTCMQIVERAEESVNSGATNLFSISGRVVITRIIGQCTENIASANVNIKLISEPTTGANADLCTNLNINGDTARTFYGITGVRTSPMVTSTSGAIQGQLIAMIIDDGYLSLNSDVSPLNGKIKWTLQYIPLDESSSVEAV